MCKKLMLKDLVGQNAINKIIDVSIKGTKHDFERVVNERLLKQVDIKKEKNGDQWLYIKWETEGRILLNDDNTCNDCGYSGVKLGENHELEKLYVNAV